ncbi:hypothetical protein QYE76_023306 [Lolium multiflorum]|uniref:Uncharacterized protein n=1 Tax=Lolium multiflorum TaxID=4521 RepID=A0AAD8RE76_LOLMU|nr:hypothetical protein QYE76_023306 [Lolium multiflorum]
MRTTATRQAHAFDDVYGLEGVEEMLDAVVACAGEDEGDGSRGALARPVRNHRVPGMPRHGTGRAWARLVRPMSWSRELRPCCVMIKSSGGDTDLPHLKKTKTRSDKPESTKKSTPLSCEGEPIVPLPRRKVMANIKASSVSPSASASVPPSSNDHPIHTAVDIVVDFADQFVRMEVENAQLRQGAKYLIEQLEKANKLAVEAQKENASLQEALKLLKKKMKEEEQSKLENQRQAYKKEGALRKSIESLLGTADMPVDRTNKLRVDSMSDALSFAVESSE